MRLVHPDAVTAPVHERDVAAVAVTALGIGAEDAVTTAPTSAAMLTGPEPISQRRQVDQIGQAIGRRLRIEELSPDQAREHYGRYSDPATVDAILQFLSLAATGGSPCTPTARRVRGRPGHSFAQWARDHAEDFG
ncbi:hypothetical protein ABZ599_39620 [Streptomyces misionensis]|uniref:hypothetical protein n=1 Tax=Streptomyces misionensis TaxID=67331 RepID=UPI0033F31660